MEVGIPYNNYNNNDNDNDDDDDNDILRGNPAGLDGFQCSPLN